MEKKNILLIMCDQLRHDYLGYMNEAVKTPNLDALAHSGKVFTNCYTNCPVCAPARISLATGLRPSRLGCNDNHAYLSIYEDTYYKRLRDSGYQVACSGKLDLAKSDGHNGLQGKRPVLYSYGFTDPYEIEGKMHAFRSTPDDILGPYGSYLDQKGKLETFIGTYSKNGDGTWFEKHVFESPLEAQDHHDCYVGGSAVKWVEHADQDYPWHMFVSFAGPHDPFDPPKENLEQVKGRAISDPIKDTLERKPMYQKHLAKKFMSGMTDEDRIKAIKHYIAYIELIDHEVGQLIEALKNSGQLDHTYIFFTADHGEMLGDHGMYQKQLAYEGALHIPLFVCGGGITPGVSDAFIELQDIGETICDLAGTRDRQNGKADAMSFKQVLFNKSKNHRECIISTINRFRCIKDANYKYVNNVNDVDELYDYINDPLELNNIIDEKAEVARSLAVKLNRIEYANRWN